MSTRDDLLERADLEGDEALALARARGAEALWRETRALRFTIAAALMPPEPRADQPPQIKEGWYSVELMGHRSREGYVRPVTLAGRPLVEITEPEHPKRPPDNSGDDAPETNPARVEFYSPAAIFSLTPSTETDVINTLAERSFVPW